MSKKRDMTTFSPYSSRGSENLSNAITNVVPLTTIPGDTQKKSRTKTFARRRTHSSRVSTFSNPYVSIKNISEMVTSTDMHVGSTKPNVIDKSRDSVNPNINETSQMISLKNDNIERTVRQSTHEDIIMDKSTHRLLSNIPSGEDTLDDVPYILTSMDKPVQPEDKHEVVVETGVEEDFGKDKNKEIVNIDECDSDDEPIRKRLALGIAKILRNRK